MPDFIAEPIEVLALFQGRTIRPMVFRWANKRYPITKVNLVHTERKGREKIFYFSVSDETNAYRLSLSSETMQWRLEEMDILYS